MTRDEMRIQEYKEKVETFLRNGGSKNNPEYLRLVSFIEMDNQLAEDRKRKELNTVDLSRSKEIEIARLNNDHEKLKELKNGN